MHSAQFILTVTILFASANFLKDMDAKWIPEYAGPYRSIFQRIYNTTDMYTVPQKPKIWTKVFFTQARPKEPQYAWGHLFLGVPLDDEIQAELRIAKRSNNQWKNNAFVMKFDKACSNMFTHIKWISDMMYGVDTYSSCPLPATGSTEVTNKTVIPLFPNFPIFPYGHWRFTLAIFKRNTLLGIVEGIFETVPKL